jgi:hypothetical protein
MRKSLPVLLAAVFILASSAAAKARNPPLTQIQTGTITGTVTDPQGAVIAGANGREPLGRNVLSAPGYGSVDLSLKKKFPLTEAHRLEVRADVFNIANRVNFAARVTDLVSADFGRSIDARSPRTVRLALKYSF